MLIYFFHSFLCLYPTFSPYFIRAYPASEEIKKDLFPHFFSKQKFRPTYKCYTIQLSTIPFFFNVGGLLSHFYDHTTV